MATDPHPLSALETWASISFLISCLLAGLLWTIFVFTLNPRFDPDWKHRRWSAFEASWRPFFGFTRAIQYAGAVCSRWIALRLFKDSSYDFRGRAGPVLYVLAIVHHASGAYLVVHSIVAALTGYSWR